jgi:hypothetical protein
VKKQHVEIRLVILCFLKCCLGMGAFIAAWMTNYQYAATFGFFYILVVAHVFYCLGYLRGITSREGKDGS